MSSANEVLTIGTWDLCHYGHTAFLRQCERLGRVTVGVNSDTFVETYKDPTVMSEEERIYAIEQLGYTAVLNEDNGRTMIEAIKPDILAVGSDWARKDYLKQIDVDQDWLDARGIILAYIPYIQKFPISSTALKQRIRGEAVSDSTPLAERTAPRRAA